MALGMETSALLDIALSGLSLYASVRGTTPPFTAAKDAKSKAGNDWVRRLGLTQSLTLYHLAFLALTLLQGRKIAQTDVTALAAWQSSGARTAFRLANAVNILGGALRIVCFRALGRFFTFDLAVQHGQRVIQTGPYAHVRHPSYTAMYLQVIGNAFSYGVFGPLLPPQWHQQAGRAATALSVISAVSSGWEHAHLQPMLTPPISSLVLHLPAHSRRGEDAARRAGGAVRCIHAPCALSYGPLSFLMAPSACNDVALLQMRFIWRTARPERSRRDCEGADSGA